MNLKCNIEIKNKINFANFKELTIHFFSETKNEYSTVCNVTMGKKLHI